MTKLEASVLMAAHDRPASLQRSLRALEDQTQDPATFEVVVVDVGTAEQISPQLDTLETRLTLRVVRLDRGNATATAAAAESEGRICIFLGADVVATPELVRTHLAAHAKNDRLFGVGALIRDVPDHGDWSARAAASSWNRRSDSRRHRRLRWPDVRAGNLSVPRRAFEELDGLPLPWAGPAAVAELALRLDSAGYSANYLVSARAMRKGGETGRRLLAERADEGLAHAELATRSRALMAQLLGPYLEASPLELLLRPVVFAVRARPAMLAALGRLVPGETGKERWLAFVSNCAYWGAVRRRVTRSDWGKLARGVPILLYHAFGGTERPSRFVVSRRAFARQMRLLSVLRFKVIAYDELVRGFARGDLPSPRTVVLTLDDGYADNDDVAAPILERQGFCATIFLVSGRLGRVNDWSEAPSLRGRPLLSEQQLATLRERGLDFGAHTRTHCPLPWATDETLMDELVRSRTDLEEALGTAIHSFAYPYGRWDDAAVDAVERAGYLSACTTEPRLARLDDHPLLIPRLEIKGSDSLFRFLLKTWFGYA
jgi:peptidoglycan/xylan/chitin deacetylase (PgdA/CDA1 family)/GT2 family glycosyltransferase